jgi:uncharacterized protein (UPF0276 family)
MSDFGYLGFGLGLRHQHYQDVINNRPPVDWFEIITEDYLIAGGNPLHYLSKIREHYPIVMHGVSLSIGSVHPLDRDYLKRVKQLAQHLQPAWVSDHLCWTGTNGLNLHDLLPLPYTEEALKHVVERVKQVQEILERRILLENVSSYVTFKNSEFAEWEFLATVAEQADCLILLDVNNVYVSSFNHGFNPQEYLNGIPVARVQQFHMAGHENNETHIIDTHDHEIITPVWALYESALQRFGQISTLIERDDHIPPLTELMLELGQARQIAQKVREKN